MTKQLMKTVEQVRLGIDWCRKTYCSRLDYNLCLPRQEIIYSLSKKSQGYGMQISRICYECYDRAQHIRNTRHVYLSLNECPDNNAVSVKLLILLVMYARVAAVSTAYTSQLHFQFMFHQLAVGMETRTGTLSASGYSCCLLFILHECLMAHHMFHVTVFCYSTEGICLITEIMNTPRTDILLQDNVKLDLYVLTVSQKDGPLMMINQLTDSFIYPECVKLLLGIGNRASDLH